MPLRRGQLVKAAGNFGIIIRGDQEDSESVSVFFGNGLVQVLSISEIEIVYLPGSEAPVSFHELLEDPKAGLEVASGIIRIRREIQNRNAASIATLDEIQALVQAALNISSQGTPITD